MKVKIYFFNDFDNFNYQRFLDQIPDSRRQKALRFSRLIDQKQSVAAFLLLRLALRDFGFYKMPKTDQNAYGKPSLTEPEGLYFNLSHCPKGVVCGVCHHEIGIDIQDIRPVSKGLINKTMTEEEKDFIQASGNIESAFARLWSKKESILKQEGRGLSGGLLSVNTLSHENVDTLEGDGYFISLSGGQICLNNVSVPDLEQVFNL